MKAICQCRWRSAVVTAYAIVSFCGGGARVSGQQGTGGAEVRRPAVAGTFYSADKSRLEKEVAALLERAGDVEPKGEEVLAAMAPHAGYRYSGQVAAYAHKGMSGTDVDVVVVIGHDYSRPGVVAWLCSVDCYQTPLGQLPVARDMVQRVLDYHPGIREHKLAHSREHTVEVQLPFLQTLGKTCEIVPVLFGEPTAAHCRILADAIESARAGRRVFVLASTDLSHYPTYAEATRLDQQTLGVLAGMDVGRLLAHLEAVERRRDIRNLETAMCASGGVGTAMLYAKKHGANKVQVLRYANSGDADAGDRQRVVGYGAVLFVKSTGKAEQMETEADADGRFTLPEPVQRELLALARSRIEAEASGRTLSYTPSDRKQLLQPAAVFVTLKKSGRLRGCIGTTAPRSPLWQAVSEMAHAAAFEDHRFGDVTKEELAALHVEVSVLSPLKRVASADAIVPVEHGVVVRRGSRQGLFLPQVWEQLPDKTEFLSILCQQKAGLPASAWRDAKTELYIFTVFAFEEE